jgi:(S)-ureidoglycine aminohydrolase
MYRATAVVHVSPAVGAGFTQYTAELEPEGSLGPAEGQRFLYVLDGEVWVDGQALGGEAYAYLPERCDAAVVAHSAARLAVIEKPYQPLTGANPPARFVADERTVEPKPLLDDPDLQIRTLLPENPSFDFAVNTMTYQPGAALPMVEMHVMEHGLLMLAGGGIYRLGDDWYPVTAGDFIWMAPYCPQWFGALGKTPAKYLIYKDWNR